MAEQACARCNLISTDFGTPHTESQCLQLMLARAQAIERTVYHVYLRAWIVARLGPPHEMQLQRSQAFDPVFAEDLRVTATCALALLDATQNHLRGTKELWEALDEMLSEGPKR